MIRVRADVGVDGGPGRVGAARQRVSRLSRDGRARNPRVACQSAESSK